MTYAEHKRLTVMLGMLVTLSEAKRALMDALNPWDGNGDEFFRLMFEAQQIERRCYDLRLRLQRVKRLSPAKARPAKKPRGAETAISDGEVPRTYEPTTNAPSNRDLEARFCLVEPARSAWLGMAVPASELMTTPVRPWSSYHG